MLHALIAAASLALTGPQVGSPAPDFHLTTLDGKRVSLADYRGKTVVLNEWGDVVSTVPRGGARTDRRRAQARRLG